MVHDRARADRERVGDLAISGTPRQQAQTSSSRGVNPKAVTAAGMAPPGRSPAPVEASIASVVANASAMACSSGSACPAAKAAANAFVPQQVRALPRDWRRSRLGRWARSRSQWSRRACPLPRTGAPPAPAAPRARPCRPPSQAEAGVLPVTARDVLGESIREVRQSLPRVSSMLGQRTPDCDARWPPRPRWSSSWYRVRLSS